jgi:Family of unknown function (DUF6334)
MISQTKIAGEALLSALGPFHEIAGLPLLTVKETISHASFSEIRLDFGPKSLLIKAESEDDTVVISVVEHPEENGKIDVGSRKPWSKLIGLKFGWGSLVINQQGYVDGVLLSFSGIEPQLLINVVASSLKVMQIVKVGEES